MRYQAALQPDLVPGMTLAGLTLESIDQYRGECRRGQITVRDRQASDLDMVRAYR